MSGPAAPEAEPDPTGSLDPTRPLDRLVAGVVGFSCAHARAVLLAFAVLCAGAVWAATGLQVNTDASRMLADDLEFQQRQLALDAAFPQLDDTIAIVVRGQPDAVDAVLEALVVRLAGDASVAETFAPSIDPFLRGHGLLYAPLPDFAARIETLAGTAPLVFALAAEPGMETLAGALVAMQARAADGDVLDPLYRRVARAIDASLAGRSNPVSWSALGSALGSALEPAPGSASDEPADAASDEPADATVQRLLQVRPVQDFTALQPVEGTMAAIRSAVAALDADLASLVTIGVTGEPALRYEELDSVASGIGLSLGASLVAVALLLALAYRSLARTLATLGALVVSLVLATGFAALAFEALNLVSVAFVVLLVGLGLDFTIHALLHLRSTEAGAPRDVLAANVAAMGRTIGGALLLSALTTALAFLAFVPTDFAGMAQLGILGAVGVGIALLVSITFVPALVCTFPRLARGIPQGTVTVRPARSRGSAQPLLVALLLALPVLAAAAAWMGQGVRFDADPTVLRDPASPSMRALAALADDPETTPYRISVLADGRDEANRLARDLAALPQVRATETLDDFVPRDQAAKLALLDRVRPVLAGTAPPSAAAADDVARAIERLSASDGEGARALARSLAAWQRADPAARARAERDVLRFLPRLAETLRLIARAGPVTLADLPAPIVALYRANEDGRDVWRVEVQPRDDLRDPAALAAFVEAVDARAEAAGAPAQILRAGETVAGAIVQAVVVAAVATLLVCLVVVRDWRLVVAIMVPLAAAAAFTAAASVWLDIAFNYANVIVLPLIVGLGVDSGIHLALRHRDAGTAALYAGNTPRAVVFSGLTTIAAFGSLGLSDHRGTASMGQMLAIAVTLTLAATLIWTPALCDALKARGKSRDPS